MQLWERFSPRSALRTRHCIERSCCKLLCRLVPIGAKQWIAGLSLRAERCLAEFNL